MARVSVIIPSYNREDLLAATLDSLGSQTYSDWEGIVVDDRSTDGSAGIARRYAERDGRFRSVSRQGDRKGANICRNQGLALAQGVYVIFLDSDDLLSPTCLEHRVAAMDSVPDCGFGVFQTELFARAVGDGGVLWDAHTASDDLNRFLSLDTVWITTAPIWKKSILVQLGGFDEEVLSFQDWDLHVRALIAGIKYFKKCFRDNFHRYDHGDAGTITASICSRLDHLRSHERLFVKTHEEFQSAGLLTHEIRCRLAGAFWWLARRQLSVVNATKADAIWRIALKLKLCNRREYIEGRIALRLYSFRGGRRLARLIQWSWPGQYLLAQKRFFGRRFDAPVGRTQPESAERRRPTCDIDHAEVTAG